MTMSTNSTALWYLESVNLFDILCPHKVEAMKPHHKFLLLKKNQFVYVPDDDANHIYMLSNGRVKIGSYLSDGKEVVKSILTEGELFGELALIGETKHGDFAQAMDDDTRICVLRIDHLKQMMFGDHELSFKLLKLVGLRLIKLERKLELLVFKDARTRVIEFIKDAASWKGKKVGFETLIPTKLTHKEIASLTGLSRQTVTTILNELKENNLINFDRRRILIRDITNLK